MIRVPLTGTVLLYKQSEDMFDLFKKKAMQCKNIQAEDFKAIIDENPDGVVLDVRTRSLSDLPIEGSENCVFRTGLRQGATENV